MCTYYFFDKIYSVVNLKKRKEKKKKRKKKRAFNNGREE